MLGLQVSISAESSSLTCHHLDIPNTTERNVVVGQEGRGAGRAHQRLLPHTLDRTPEHTSGYLGPPHSLLSSVQNTDRFNYFLNYSLAPGIILCRPLRGLVLFKVTLRLLILML